MLEPLRELFKDEVRQVGARLGIPEAILQRPSFPGSGLALRILGEVTPSRLQTLRAADQIFTGEIAESGQAKRLRHYFAVLTPLPENDTQAAIILRAVQAGEAAQQAYAARLPYCWSGSLSASCGSGPRWCAWSTTCPPPPTPSAWNGNKLYKRKGSACICNTPSLPIRASPPRTASSSPTIR